MKRRTRRAESFHPESDPEPAPIFAPDDESSRRRFLQVLASASAALPTLGVVGTTSAMAQTPAASEQPPEVEPWLAIVRQRYGDHLSSDQLQAVAENLAWTARTGKTLRAAALTNADEPDVVFRAEPPEPAR